MEFQRMIIIHCYQRIINSRHYLQRSQQIQIHKNPMTIKGDQKAYKLDQYEIVVNAINDRKVHIQAVDTALRIQFAQNELVLENIATSTLILALEGTRKQVSIIPAYKKEGEFEVLELKIRIESSFLKTIEETLFIKKFRDVEEFQIIDKRLRSLNQKLRKIKEENVQGGNTLCTYQPEDQHFCGASYETLSSIKLKKGKYMITFSFMLKATNQWLYIYMGQGEAIMSNSGFYVPTTSQWMPFTVRVIKKISEEQKEVQFTTSSASSYQVYLKNRIITAQKLPDS